MNNSSLSLMTYCSLAKELIGIKNSTHPLKYLTFTQQSQWLGKKEERKGMRMEEKKEGEKKERKEEIVWMKKNKEIREK
mgnify:CR=1 FL=1